MRERLSSGALSLRYRLECDPCRAVPLHPPSGQPRDMRLEHPAVQVCVVRPDAAEPPVFCRCDASDDHRALKQRSTLGRVHDHPVHEDTAGHDVFPVQTRTRPPGGGADVARRRQSSPTSHNGVQDSADLQIVRDACYVLCLDFPILREIGRSLGTGDQLASPLRLDSRCHAPERSWPGRRRKYCPLGERSVVDLEEPSLQPMPGSPSVKLCQSTTTVTVAAARTPHAPWSIRQHRVDGRSGDRTVAPRVGGLGQEFGELTALDCAARRTRARSGCSGSTSSDARSPRSGAEAS